MNKNKALITITNVALKVKQPKGGYLALSKMTRELYEYDNEFIYRDNVGPKLSESVVEHLSEYLLGADKKAIFSLSMMGAKILGKEDKANALLESITDLEDDSILAAVNLTRYEHIATNSFIANKTGDFSPIELDKNAYHNIKTMVRRVVKFFESKNIVKVHNEFTSDAYTATINNGYINVLTEDTLWEIRAINTIISGHTLILLIKLCMAIKSNDDCYKNIKYIGIFNAKTCESMIYPVESIPEVIRKEIETDVIGY